jgi:hypothetical protein
VIAWVFLAPALPRTIPSNTHIPLSLPTSPKQYTCNVSDELLTPWLNWQGENGVQSNDLDGVGSIPAIPRRRLPALLIISINKNVCFLSDEFDVITVNHHVYFNRIMRPTL